MKVSSSPTSRYQDFKKITITDNLSPWSCGCNSFSSIDDSSSSLSSSPLIDEVPLTTTSTNPKSNSSKDKPFEQEFSQHHELHYHYAQKQYWLQNFSASITDWLYPPGVPQSCQLLWKENLAVPASYMLVGILEGKYLYTYTALLLLFLFYTSVLHLQSYYNNLQLKN